jgi:hypothetical protein
MKVTELVEAIELLRKAGWRVEPPAKSGSSASRLGGRRRVGRPPKNGRRKRGRPPKDKRRKPGASTQARNVDALAPAFQRRQVKLGNVALSRVWS